MTTILPGDKLGMWTIYHQPELEHPYRVRLWKIDGSPEPVPTETTFGADTLDGIRAIVQHQSPGLICFPRNPADPPEVVETWF